MTVLTTERLILRLPVLADFAPLRDILTSERARYMGGPYTEMGAWREFCMDVAGWSLFGHGGWSVTDRHTGALLGEVSLNRRPDFPERELGWMLLPEAEGQGYAFEAATAARDHAFGTLGWKTLVSYVDPGNDRAVRLAERMGALRDEKADRPGPTDMVFRHLPPEAQP